MPLWMALCILSLILFSWNVYDIVRHPHSALRVMPRWMTISFFIISVVLYVGSSWNLLSLYLDGLPFAVKLFLFLGVALSLAAAGWVGCKIADGQNHSDHIRQVRNLEGQIKDIKNSQNT